MAYDKELLKEFAEGAAEISARISQLSEKLMLDTSTTSESPLSTIRSLITEMEEPATFIRLNEVAVFLRHLNTTYAAIGDNNLTVSQQLVTSIKEILNKFVELLNEIEKNANGPGEKDTIAKIQTLSQSVDNAFFQEEQKIQEPQKKEIQVSQNTQDDEDDVPEIDMELIPDFVADSEEQISAAEENFLLLAENGFNQNVVNTAYRNIHSIKGNCGFIHLYQMQNLCHAIETIMEGMRQKTVETSKENVSFLLEYLDIIKETVTKLSKGGNGSIAGLKGLIKKAENKFPASFGIEPEPEPEPKKPEVKVEEKKPEPVKPEVKIELPKTEPPKSEEPKVEKIKEEVKSEEPKPEPIVEDLFTEPEPTAEKPVVEETKIEVPIIEFPEINEIKVEEKFTEAPKTKKTKTKKIKAETPIVEAEIVELPPVEEMIIEEIEVETVIAETQKSEVKKGETKKNEAPKAEEKSNVNIKNAAEMEDEIGKIIVSEDMRHNFIADSGEQLSAVEEDFLALEQNGFDSERINNAYRNIHSFKGNCSFMRLEDLKNISHTMETIMQFMREQKIPIDGKAISFLLNYLDLLRNGVTLFEQSGEASIPNVEEYRKNAEEAFPECFTDENRPIKITKKSKKEEELLAASMAQTQTNMQSHTRHDIRVDLRKLENIINLAGELVIAESMVTRNPVVSSLSSEALNRSIHQLRRICNDLQDAAMVLRMVSLEGVFKKMTRLVHDLSNNIGKKINFKTIGRDTEVDKSVSELINDPLVHIIRNACDHGIETPQERLAAGKSEVGTITLSSEHRSGAVWISVKDDGRGLNREKILKRAISLGIITPEEEVFVPDNDVWQMILLPGFSTATIVSDISGRGVGMDVVQKNIEGLRGQIYIKTKEGYGTEFSIRIPLTLAIIDGMIIRVVNSLYIIPTLSIKQSLKYNRELINYSPENEEILKFQDKLIPIVRLANLFENDYNEKPENGILIVVEDGESLIALFVDSIVEQQQVVIKGLSDYMNKTRGTSSCTILGDGSVALILDIDTLAEMALEKVSKTQKIPIPLNKPIKEL